MYTKSKGKFVAAGLAVVSVGAGVGASDLNVAALKAQLQNAGPLSQEMALKDGSNVMSAFDNEKMAGAADIAYKTNGASVGESSASAELKPESSIACCCCPCCSTAAAVTNTK